MGDGFAAGAGAVDVGAFVRPKDGKVRIGEALGGYVDVRPMRSCRRREEDGLPLSERIS